MKKNKNKTSIPSGGLEPPIFGLGDRRLIHWATRADEKGATFLQNKWQVRTQPKNIYSLFYLNIVVPV